MVAWKHIHFWATFVFFSFDICMTFNIWKKSFLLLLLLAGVSTMALPNTVTPEKAKQKQQKAWQDSLRHDMREARYNTNDKDRPNFSEARKNIEHALQNPYGKDNPDVLLQAGHTEYACFQYERNRPASGGKMDEKVIYASTAAGFQYYTQAYQMYRHPAKGKVVTPPSNKGYVQMRSNAYELYRCTQGFRATAGYYAKQKDWKSAHTYYKMALEAMDSEILRDYARTDYEVRVDFDKFRTDSIRKRLTYACAVTAVQMQDHQLAVQELEAAKYTGIEANRIRQQLCKEYLVLNDTAGYQRALLEAVNLLPKEVWFAESLLNLYLTRGQHREALSVIDKVIDNVPNPAHTYELKGQLLDEAGDLDGAVSAYMQAITADSTLVVSYSAMGRIYFNRAIEAENALVDARQFDQIYSVAVPLYEAALPYYNKAYDNDKDRKDESIASAIRTILYKRFQSPKCRNARQLIRRYNEVSLAYGMSTL